MMNTRKFILTASMAGLVLFSCSDDDDNPVAVSPEEVITTMTVTLTDGTDTVTLSVFDEDGQDGPVEPVPTISGSLKTNTTYNGTVLVLNETEDPAEEVNDEIKEEADEHQFFYLTDDLGIATMYTDQECDYDDTDDPCEGSLANPVGITFTLTTTDAVGDAQLRVILQHELDKDAEGVSEGNISNAGGTPDIDYPFNISVE